MGVGTGKKSKQDTGANLKKLSLAKSDLSIKTDQSKGYYPVNKTGILESVLMISR